MTKLVRSARGELVDFDLIKIKQQLADTPAPTEVKARENFVEKRLKRKLRNKTVPSVAQEEGSSDSEDTPFVTKTPILAVVDDKEDTE